MKNPFEKKDNSVQIEKQKKMKEIDSFFKQKVNEFFEGHGIRDVKNNIYFKPYAKGINDVGFGEALRELQIGRKDRALKVLNQMIEKAIKIDPSWPDIKEMQNLVKYLEEATNEDLEMIEGITRQNK